MKPQLFIAVIAIALSGCSFTKPHEKLAREQAHQQGLQPVSHAYFDAIFLAPSADLSRYKSVKVENLDLSHVTIRKPSSQRVFDEPWELNDKDRAYYQDKYVQAVKENLIDTGFYTLTDNPGSDGLILRGKVLEIAPLAPKDDAIGRPTRMDVYSRGFGQMTVEFELYDATTNKLLFTATDEHDLGTLWEKNNRVENNMQVRLAFEHWMLNLKAELEKITGRKASK